MAKADVLALVRVLGNGMAPPLEIERAYGQALEVLALRGHLNSAEAVEVEAEQGTFVLAPHMVGLECVFYDGNRLSKATEDEARASFGSGWRSLLGTPQVYVRDLETVDTWRLCPRPARSTVSQMIPLWSPLGQGFAEGGLVLLVSVRDVDVPEWLELWTTLFILSRVFAYDSDVKDMALAAMCDSLAMALAKVLAL